MPLRFDYSWNFFSECLVKGTMLAFSALVLSFSFDAPKTKLNFETAQNATVPIPAWQCGRACDATATRICFFFFRMCSQRYNFAYGPMCVLSLHACAGGWIM